MRHHFLLSALLFISIATFSSCSADDEPQNPSQPSEEEWIDPDFAHVLETKGYITSSENVTPSDVADIVRLDIEDNSLSSLKGIEYFSKLEVLYCSDNQLTQLDVSKNSQLTYLSCSNNQLTQLDVSKNSQLIYLFCASNQLTRLDVSNNSHLAHLYCASNQLTQLDVSNNSQLTDLYCYNNQLTQLDLSNNSQLAGLDCYFNHLTQLNVSNNSQLTHLHCSSNQLTQLDISRSTKLIAFFCHNNPGENGLFRLKSWFDNSSVPTYITAGTNILTGSAYKASWVYNGTTVRIDYYKQI